MLFELYRYFSFRVCFANVAIKYPRVLVHLITLTNKTRADKTLFVSHPIILPIYDVKVIA